MSNPNFLAPRTINLETPDYIVRTLDASDATESWRHWMTDPATMRNLNAQPTVLTDTQIRDYIARFDRKTSHLLGIFDKQSGTLIGIRAVYIDPVRSEFLVNVLVGETEARNKGARTQSRTVMYRYFFEELDLQTARASAVSTNEPIINMMHRNGWIREHTDRKPAASGQGTIELYHYRLPREVWRQTELERGQAQTS